MPVKILQDVSLHLHGRRTHEENLHPVEFRQQIRQRPHRPSAVKFPDKRDTEPVDRTLAVNRVKVEQSLRRMLAAVTISRVNDGYGRDFGCATRPPGFVMPNYDRVAIRSND